MNNINNTSRIIVPIMTHRSNGSDVVRGSKCYEEKCKTQEELALEKEKRGPVSSLLNQRVALSKSKLHDRKEDRKDVKKDADLERVDLRSSKLHDRKEDRKDVKKDADLERVDLRSSKLHDRKEDRKDVKKDADLERVDLSKKNGKFFMPLGLSRPEILKEKWNAFNAWKKEALS
ncbi:MAG: pentapeptide repeat-containing protein [Candidatus Xiphinematobacter sp.]|nr:MAG: pentapeptide repeat-containing protein [Candidatus Xiphinematobacter sp.]